MNWSSTVVFFWWRCSFKVFERFSGRATESHAESVRCSNLGRNRRKLLIQVVTSPLQNARQQKRLGWILEEDLRNGCSVFQYMCYTLKNLHCSMAMCHVLWDCIYLFVWPKSLLIVNYMYIIKSLYSMVKINLEYFHCITYSRTWWNDLETVVFSSNRNRTSRCFLLLAFSSIS